MKSNCLIQAIFHRFKGCPIYQVLPYDGEWNYHIVWWDAELNSYRHFTWGGNKEEQYKYFDWLNTKNKIYLPKIPYLKMFEGNIENYEHDKNRERLRLIF